MIFRPHRKAFHAWIKRWSLRNRPRKEYTAPFQTKVVVKMRGQMLLCNVNERPSPPLLNIARARWLGRRIEVTLLSIFVEFHTSMKGKKEVLLHKQVGIEPTLASNSISGDI